MTISLTQAILLGLFCGLAKTCIPYTWGAFAYNTVIFNAGNDRRSILTADLFRSYLRWW